MPFARSCCPRFTTRAVLLAALLCAAGTGVHAQESPEREDEGQVRLLELQQAVAALSPSMALSERAEAFNSLGLQHWTLSRFDSALVHLRRAQQLWMEAADTAGLGRAWNNIGVTYYQWGHYEPALDAFRQSLRMREYLGDTRGRSLVLSNIGSAYRDLQLYDRALPALEAAVAASDSTGEAAPLGYALYSYGLLQRSMGNYAEARYALERSVVQYGRIEGNGEPRRRASSGWALNGVQLGLLDALEGDVGAGIALLTEIREIARADRHVRREAMTLLHLGRAYRIRGDLRSAAQSLEGALEIAQATEQRSIALDALEQLADTYQARGETALALAHLRSHQALRDTLFSQHALQRIAAAESRELAAQQEAENALLRQEQIRRDGVIAKQRIAVLLGGALLVMALLLVLVLVRYNRTGRARERLLAEANLALADANRDLRVALSEVRTLKGLIPICSHCKKVRDDQGFWEAVETYITNRSDALFSHSICADCGPTVYGSDWPGPEPRNAPAEGSQYRKTGSGHGD